MDEHINVLEHLDASFKQNPKFEQMFREFESQKVCYLPFTTFVLRPLHRLIQYRTLINSEFLSSNCTNIYGKLCI